MRRARFGSDRLPRVRLALSLALALAISSGCTSSVDTVGFSKTNDEPVAPAMPSTPVEMPSATPPSVVLPVAPPATTTEIPPVTPARWLRPLTGPATYPNAFRDVLGKTDAQIAKRINDAFQQLFYGNPDSEAIYYEDGDGAYIRDILHGEVRTEGMGLGMMIAVQLDKREEFDRLWRYAKSEMQVHTGVNAGYFRSRCNLVPLGTEDCLDPYGFQQFLMSLIFAHGRWGSKCRAPLAPEGCVPSDIDYEAEALALFDILRNKEEMNGGIKGGATNTFDHETKLVFDVPNQKAATFTRPAIEMPAYYALWAQATGDPFYTEAAEAARAFWKLIAHPDTGLMPGRVGFDGRAIKDWSTFSPECYRTYFNQIFDVIWSGSTWSSEEADKIIAFFASKGIASYGGEYTLDGGVVDPAREPALISANGALALVATIPEREAFIEAVWNFPLTRDAVRYYSGTVQLLALMTLGGRFRVW
jgi:oligosaccharide reducing-end xylanase